MADDSLDLDRLQSYLSQHVDGFPALKSATKFADGQSNPTFLLQAEGAPNEVNTRFVLRRKPLGSLLKSAHAVDREYRVIAALDSTDVPVPAALHLCEDPEIIGSDFYIMSFVDGRTFWDPALPEFDNPARAACYREMNKTLAAIHSVDLEKVGLADFGKPGNYFERQYSRWVRQYRATITEHIQAMEDVIAWLEANMVPDDGRVSLVHGDFRLDNLLFTPDGTEILAVLDWELSTLGHPFADLAYQCALWRMPQQSALRGMRGVDREALGIPSEQAYVAEYCRRMGLQQIENWTFYRAFSLFRLAAIVQGVKKRALEGNASSSRALEVGGLTAPLAAEALALITEV